MRFNSMQAGHKEKTSRHLQKNRNQNTSAIKDYRLTVELRQFGSKAH